MYERKPVPSSSGSCNPRIVVVQANKPKREAILGLFCCSCAQAAVLAATEIYSRDLTHINTFPVLAKGLDVE
jgi:hypothetical protein